MHLSASSGKATGAWDQLDDTWASGTQAQNVSVAFKFTHAASAAETATHGQMNIDSDFAIAADICNFAQNNATDNHNCIYRIAS